jgi:hypothetical protein
MKVRLLALAGLAISFALPTFAQEKDTVDPQTRQQLEAIIKKYEEAFNKHDAAAVAAFYTEDAVLDSPLGVFSGRAGVEKYYLEVFQQFNSTDLVIRLDYIYAFGTDGFNRVFGENRRIGGKIPNYGVHDVCAIGKFTANIPSGQSGGNRSAIYTPEGDAWKIRVLIVRYNP